MNSPDWMINVILRWFMPIGGRPVRHRSLPPPPPPLWSAFRSTPRTCQTLNLLRKINPYFRYSDENNRLRAYRSFRRQCPDSMFRITVKWSNSFKHKSTPEPSSLGSIPKRTPMIRGTPCSGQIKEYPPPSPHLLQSISTTFNIRLEG